MSSLKSVSKCTRMTKKKPCIQLYKKVEPRKKLSQEKRESINYQDFVGVYIDSGGVPLAQR